MWYSSPVTNPVLEGHFYYPLQGPGNISGKEARSKKVPEEREKASKMPPSRHDTIIAFMLVSVYSYL